MLDKINFEIKNNLKQETDIQSAEILLADCDISTRALNSLMGLSVIKLTDATAYTEQELIEKLPNRAMVKELKEALSKRGLGFKTSD